MAITDVYRGRCPNCEYEMIINEKKLTRMPPHLLNLLYFLESLPAFSETPMKIIKHDGQLRLEVEKTIEKIIL